MREPKQEVTEAVKFLLRQSISRETITFVLRNEHQFSLEQLKDRLFGGTKELPESVHIAFKNDSKVYADRLHEAWMDWLEIIVAIEFEKKLIIRPLVTIVHNSFEDPDPRN